MAGAVLLAAVLVVGSLLLVPPPPQRMAVPTAGELVELEPYLGPVEVGQSESAGLPEPVILGGDPFGGGVSGFAAAGDPPSGSGASGGSEGTRSSRWNLSAIMMAGDRRIAILNDELVRPGDRLEGGARVEMVESDHIVIIMPGGERRRVELER